VLPGVDEAEYSNKLRATESEAVSINVFLMHRNKCETRLWQLEVAT